MAPAQDVRNLSEDKLRYLIRNRGGILSFCRADYAAPGPRATVFLDRDGVLNKRIKGGYVTQLSEFALLPGVLGALRRLRNLGFQLVIVSNQAAVAKGLLTWEALAHITQMSLNRFQAAGGAIDAAFFCLHQSSDSCECRKPGPGLLQESAGWLKIDFNRSFLIGDSPADIVAGAAMNCKTVYLARFSEANVKATHQARTLRQAVRWIEGEAVGLLVPAG
jgi:histidinol-phosphate phosphatase family protein